MVFIIQEIRYCLKTIIEIGKQTAMTLIQYYKSSFLLLITCGLILISACDDKEEPEPTVEVSSLTDIEGNVYKTVKIGDQWWMAENLNVTTYRNGNPIALLLDDQFWNDTMPGYCSYPGTSGAGKLYNGYAVNDTNQIAPDGWHIPTDSDWKKLESFLGMSTGAANQSGWRGSSEGDKLKAKGIDKWFRIGEVWGTDSYQFKALATSCRIYDGSYGVPGIGYTGFWWTATKNIATNELFFRYLDYQKSGIYRGAESMKMGCSIRCVKN